MSEKFEKLTNERFFLQPCPLIQYHKLEIFFDLDAACVSIGINYILAQDATKTGITTNAGDAIIHETILTIMEIKSKNGYQVDVNILR